MGAERRTGSEPANGYLKVKVHWADIGGHGRTDVAEVDRITNLPELLGVLNEQRFIRVRFEEDVLWTLLNVAQISSVEERYADPMSPDDTMYAWSSVAMTRSGINGI